MSDNAPPLPLSQVLEEEYIKIHNATAPAYPKDAGERDRLAFLFKLVHALPRSRSALCISGGGIRSATFGLGIIQGLARCGVLDKFDYISTVSGGGYIGSWLTAWMHRDGRAKVIDALKAKPAVPDKPEPDSVRYLRDQSNYLNPKLGLLSADTWTLVATVLRNLLLNWLVFIPLLAAALTIPRICTAILGEGGSNAWATVCLWAGCILMVWAIGYIGLHRPSMNRTKDGSQAGYLGWCLLPLTLASLLLSLYWAWLGHQIYWPDLFSFELAGNPVRIGQDLAVFIACGIVINFIGFLGGAVLKPREIRWTSLWESVAVIVTGAVGGCLVWCVGFRLFPNPLANSTSLLVYVCFAAPAFLTALMIAESIFVGLSSYWTSDHDREWWARSGAWILIYVAGWSAVSALLIFGPMAMLRLSSELKIALSSIGGISGLVTILMGRSLKTPSRNKSEKGKNGDSGMGVPIMRYALALAAPLFSIFLILLIALGTEVLFHGSIPLTWEGYQNQIGSATPAGKFSVFAIGLTVFGFVMGIFININKFSLHAMYRNRLIRAYLGASRKDRAPDFFTGFDDKDNILMHTLCADSKPSQPFPVINMALNLVAGKNLAWQQRKAESFTVSPLHCGSCSLKPGYRRTQYASNSGKPVCYGGKEGISLGTAMAISGAAASPNMGYHSSPVITFLMTLFNARLGWWLGNPGVAGKHTFRHSGPLLAAKSLMDEAFGLTDDENRYIYLSDGGHFENLALYEMVLRRCHFIVLSDAGQDGDFQFSDLGNAIRKIRIDLGIPITFVDGINIYPRSEKKNGYYCALGTVGYSKADGNGTDGVLVYIKPAFYGNEPRDIYQYAQSNQAFPHDPTADQWFDESQFESYRMLGAHIIERVCRYTLGEPCEKDISLEEFVKKVRQYLNHPPS